MKCAVIIEKAGNNFCATSPDVPGCLATGDTIEETRAHFQEALRFHLAALREEGGQLPTPTTVEVMVDVEEVA